MIGQFWAILDKDQRRQFGFLLVVFIANAMLEFFGLSAVFALALNMLSPRESLGPARLMTGLLGPLLRSREATPTLAGIVIVAFFVKSCLGVAANWLRADIVYRQKAVLSERLLRNYLRRDWASFSRDNVALLTSKVTADCTELTANLLNQVAIGATELCVCIAVAVGLTFISPEAVFAMGLFVVILVAGLHRLLRSWMYRFGDISWQARIEANRTVETALRGAREVMLYDRREVFLQRLRRAEETERSAGALAMTFNDSPRQVIEFFTVATFFGLMGAEAAMGRSLPAVGVIATVFAAAAFRVLPSISRLSICAARISNIRPIFDALREGLAIPPKAAAGPPVERLPLADAIELHEVSFRHAGAERDALSKVSLRIPRGRSVGVVGRSGAGKTTLMELLLGLLTPTTGEVRVDGATLDAATQARWQAGVGYVPQEPYLCDDTIAANIAFGVPPEEMDPGRIRRAARLAGIADFIETETPRGYDTPVGDGGGLISGGQRQRLVIARALYREPQVLVFDEATSALDNVTETVVNQAIAALEGEMTVVVVAHRLTSVRHCSEILVLERGRLAQRGTYEELSRQEGVFRRLLRSGTRQSASG